MENQDKGRGPTYWHPPYPKSGFQTYREAALYVDGLGTRYIDVGDCHYCMKDQSGT